MSKISSGSPTLAGAPAGAAASPSGGAAPPPAPSTSSTRRLGDIGERYALVALLVGIVAFFSILPETGPTFSSWTNIQQVLSNQAVVMVIAIGMLFPLVMGSFDISVGALSGACAVVCATTMDRLDFGLLPAVGAGLAFGMVVGAIHGLLIAGLRLNAFIVTLGSSTLLAGLVQAYTGGNDIQDGISPTLSDFGAGTWLGIPSVLYLVAVVVLIGWYVLGHTPFGRYVHAVGSNERAAQLVGIDVRRLTFICFFVSGLVAGLAGVMLVAINAAARAADGPGLLFPVLTAVFLSATTIKTGIYNVLGTVVGVLLVAFSVSGLILLGADTWVSDVFNGIALIIAVTVSTVLARQRERA